MLFLIPRRCICLSVHLRNPMIKFRYGSREQHQGVLNEDVPQESLAPSKATPSASHASEPIFDYELPLKYRRVPMEEIEMEYINRGGPD